MNGVFFLFISCSFNWWLFLDTIVFVAFEEYGLVESIAMSLSAKSRKKMI